MMRIAFMCLTGACLVFAAVPTPASASELAVRSPTPLPAYTRPKPKEGYSYPDCYCTDSNGQRVEVGQLACLRIGRKEVISRCEQADNLTIWRHQGEGCPGV